MYACLKNESYEFEIFEIIQIPTYHSLVLIIKWNLEKYNDHRQ